MLYAIEKYFGTWAVGRNAVGTGRSRHDYDCPDHLLAEMLNEGYFRTVRHMLAGGDLIWVTDAANETAVIKINDIDERLQLVFISLVERISERPITATVVTDQSGLPKIEDMGLTIRNRGPRGGLWSIIDAEGNVLKRDMRTRDEANRELTKMSGEPIAEADAA